MRRIFFLFVGEGESDSALVAHLEDLCILCGADEARGVAPNLAALPARIGHSVADKIKAAVTLEPGANLVFVHRDADARDASPRHEEIRQAIDALSIVADFVAVVPVQSTEAWLLLDEAAIRQVADNPRGRAGLDLPRRADVERLANPKEHLWNLLRAASELSGRRLDKFNKTLKRRRRILLERLDAEGPVREVPAWQRLWSDLQEILQHNSQ